MQFADGTPTVWTSYGNTAQVSNAAPASGIGFGLDPATIAPTGKNYHDYIRFVITGAAVIENYVGVKNIWLPATAGAISYPLTVNQGGTGSNLEYGWAANLYYLATATGAVERTAQSKLGDFVSLKDFGCVGDGTTDNSACLQAAINYTSGLSASGVAGVNSLFVPPGKYAYATTLNIRNPIRIYGAIDNYPFQEAVPVGEGSHLHYTGSGTAIDVRAGNYDAGGTCHRVFLEKLVISSASGTATTGVAMMRCEEWGMTNVRFGMAVPHGAAGFGFVTALLLDHGGLYYVRDASFSNASGEAVRLIASPSGEFVNSNIWDCVVAFHAEGLQTVKFQHTWMEEVNVPFLFDNDTPEGFPINRQISITDTHWSNGPSTTYYPTAHFIVANSVAAKPLLVQALIENANVILNLGSDYFAVVTAHGNAASLVQLDMRNVAGYSFSTGIVYADAIGIAQASFLDSVFNTLPPAVDTPASAGFANAMRLETATFSATASQFRFGSADDNGAQVVIRGNNPAFASESVNPLTVDGKGGLTLHAGTGNAVSMKIGSSTPLTWTDSLLTVPLDIVGHGNITGATIRTDGTGNGFSFLKTALNRLSFNLCGAESTGNAGSSLCLFTFTDTGAFLANPLTVNRANGFMIVGPSFGMPGTHQFEVSGTGYLTQTLILNNPGVYANNAAAISAGLATGTIYRITGTDTTGIVH